MVEPAPELMTVKETAAYLRIPMPTVYYLVQRGKLPAVQIGGRWRIKRSLLDSDVLHNDEPSGQPVVLVVDDDAESRSLLKQFLKKAGFIRLIVASGSEAIDLVRKQKFEFVFLDLNLPGMPSDEAYRQIKSLHPDLPVVVMAEHFDIETLNNISVLGPVMLLKKPTDFDRLNMMVKQLGHKGVAAET